jgi:hypothetical protein
MDYNRRNEFKKAIRHAAFYLLFSAAALFSSLWILRTGW